MALHCCGSLPITGIDWHLNLQSIMLVYNIMDRSQRLSRKARGVLYGLCKTLKQNNTNLHAVVQQTFDFRKEKFRPK